jgi:O-antigen biosynthesis protein
VSASRNARRPRLLYLVHALPPEEQTGTPHLAVGYAEELARRDWDVTILYVSPQTGSWDSVAPEHRTGESFTRIAVPLPPPSTRGHLWSIGAPSAFVGPDDPRSVTFERILTELSPDIVHVLDNVNLSLDWPERAALRGIPVVRTVSNAEDLCGLIPPVSPISDQIGYCLPPLTPERCARCLVSTGDFPHVVSKRPPGSAGSNGQTTSSGNEDQRSALVELLEQKRARTTTQYAETFTRVIFSSTGFRSYFEGTVPLDPSRAVVIPLGIDPVSGQSRQEGPKERNGPLVFGSFGTVATHKGVDALADTFLSPAMCNRDDYRLAIYGDGDESLIRELLIRNLNVRWHGSYRPDDLPTLLDGIDVGLSVSRWETFHRVTREYLLSGIPVIGSTAFGIPEVVRHGQNGLLFEHAIPGSLLGAVTALLEDAELLARLTAGAQATVVRSISEEVDDLVALYQECV